MGTDDLTRKGRHRMSANATALTEMINFLCKGQYTKDELAEKVGVTVHTIIKWIKLGRRKGRRLYYIYGYRKGPVGQPAALWAFGPDEKDAEKPKPLTQKQYNERSKIRKQLKAKGTVAGMAQLLKSSLFDTSDVK